MVPGMGDHSPPATPVTLLNRASLYGAFEAEVLGEPAELTLGFRLIGDGRDLAHSLGPGILVAKKCTSIFYRSVGWIPGLCFHVSFIHF